MASHDAADLVLAATADHQGKLTKASGKAPSMVDCLNLITVKQRGGEKPSTYFRDLNEVRDSLKHVGILPNKRQWGQVGRDTYQKLSHLCSVCIGLSLDEIDESALLRDEEVRAHFSSARDAAGAGQYKQALEEIGKALSVLLDANASLSDIYVGEAKAEHAIKLSGLGVPANDFLRLQEFLPKVTRLGDGPFSIMWKQSEFGHPGNWHEDAARFCLETFLQIAPRIQDAKWIPGAVELWYLYEYKVTAREDNVEIWEEVQLLLGVDDDDTEKTKQKVGQLQSGESRIFRASHQPLVSQWHDDLTKQSLTIVELRDHWDIGSVLFGGPSRRFVERDKVTISCVPSGLALKHSPDLVEIPWKSDDETTEEQS
ncbi:MAG TPA: hypothetical protein VKB26_15790 [Candidatus Acidoferrales bacterium]|nr:hypothetical protein [Candidatus Acidoferrales bacterium]